MKMRKLSALLAASALLLALASACGQGQGSNPSAAPSQPPNTAAPASSTGTGPADGASITTNGGEVIALSALEHQSESGSTVYYLSDITPEAMVAIYEALEWSPTGKVAVKLSTGEPPNSNYLRPELIKDVVQGVDGTIVENNTAYGGSRAETTMHYQVAKDHGFNDIADVVILDENGSMSLPVEGGSVLSENLVGAHFADYDSYLVPSHFKGHAMAGFGGAIKNISISTLWSTPRTSDWAAEVIS